MFKLILLFITMGCSLSFAQQKGVVKKIKATDEQTLDLKKIAFAAANSEEVLKAVSEGNEKQQDIKVDLTEKEVFSFDASQPDLKAHDKPKLRHKYVGASVDLGLPAGLGLSVVARPLDLLQFFFGASYNFVSPGIRGGVTADFVDNWISPSATLELGYVFKGDYNGIVSHFSNSVNTPFLKSIEYFYTSGLLGLEFGDRRTWRLSVKMGASYMKVSVNDFQSAIQQEAKNNTITTGNPDISIVLPVGDLGFKYFF